MKGKKKKLSIDEKFANAGRILETKELKSNGRELFDKAIKKAVTVKQHGSK